MHGASEHASVLGREVSSCSPQVVYTVYEDAMLQPLLDTVNEEKAKAAEEES